MTERRLSSTIIPMNERDYDEKTIHNGDENDSIGVEETTTANAEEFFPCEESVSTSNKKSKSRKITGIAIFVALEIVLSFISNYVQTGQVNLNLALIPIIVGACAYGAVCGMLLGILNGIITLTAPATLGFFFVFNPVATVFLCLLKTGLAGLICGFISKAFKKHTLIGAILSSAVVPIVNTGLFILGVFAFFTDAYATLTDSNVYEYVLVSVLSLNFVIEFIVCAVISPAIIKITNRLR